MTMAKPFKKNIDDVVVEAKKFDAPRRCNSCGQQFAVMYRLSDSSHARHLCESCSADESGSIKRFKADGKFYQKWLKDLGETEEVFIDETEES